MREYRPKEKRLEGVLLPGELVGFLVDVLARIRRNEPEAMLESDDLLQDRAVYGGRLEEDGDEWGFTFFPASDGRAKWELTFTRAQLEAISSGEVRSVEFFTRADPACRCRFASADGRGSLATTWICDTEA